MKTLVILFAISIIGTSLTNDIHNPIQKIDQIFNSNAFKVTIERLDFGYILNQQVYAFNKTEKSLTVSQIELLSNAQNTSLNNTELKLETSQLLANYCTAIKSFELTKNDEHKELFNTTDIHDFVYLTTLKDTVLLSDVHAKAIN
jgi:hypothetical protein